MRTLDETIAKEKANAEKLRKIIETGYDGEISIEALFCDDTSAIKEAYERFENCAKEHEQLEEWLEELKAYREIGTVEECRNSVLDIERAYNKGYADGSLSVTSEIRNKVIDECLGVLYRNGGKIISIRFYEEIFKEMENLKAGGENE